ncbi:DUF2382 domain-containing protein [Niallia sp. XMNu-256]|uniref:YsnF/AvaK domain-containing protein n=1 Tax=Niallia sp. XMNu-256 TaxID=3082444 RepID=UPI0030D2F171
MNESKKIIGVFQNQAELLSKIEELTLKGYSQDDIYVITKDDEAPSILRGRVDVEVQSANRSWSDRFISFLTGEDPVREKFRMIGFTDVESERYYNEIENGGYLLYVDQEYNDLNTDLTATDLTGTNLTEEEKLRLHEERLNVNKERVKTGEMRVDKEVVEENQVLEVPVEREEVYVERRPVEDNNNIHLEDDVFDKTARPFKDGETIRVPITEERVEVTKKPVVSEEVVIGKRKTQDTETVRETVLREKANIHEENETLKEQDRELEAAFYEELNRKDDKKRGC